VQLRTPVRVSSGIYPNRDLDDMRELGMRDILSNASYGNVSAYNAVANGFKYQGRPVSPEYDDADMAFTPPTYEEAIKIGMRKSLEKETGLSSEGW
jgi:hypothetical protein